MTVCLVTGGAGFIGSHLVEALLNRGHIVRVLDDLRTGKTANLEEVSDRIEFVLGDVRDEGAVRQALRGVGCVFHLAPPVGPDDVRWGGDTDPIDQGIWQVLIAARDSLVQRVVYASSLRVYGEAPGAPLSEDDAACPRSAYATAKLSGEQDCTTFTHMYGLATVRLRYSNVFGPRQVPSPFADDVILRLGSGYLAGESPLLPGDGLQPIDLLFVDDAVEATLLAAEAPRAPGKVFNIGRGIPVTPLQVAARLGHLMGGGYRPPLLGGPCSPAELRNLADVTRARTVLRFQPAVDLDCELARCVASHGWGGKRGWSKLAQGW